MDFTKLNNEFITIQKKLEKYDYERSQVILKIKALEKELFKMENKVKDETNPIDKAYLNLVIEIKKDKLLLLKNIFVDEVEIEK